MNDKNFLHVYVPEDYGTTEGRAPTPLWLEFTVTFAVSMLLALIVMVVVL